MNAFANGRNGWTFHQLYARDATPIANGGFGSVYVATHKRTAAQQHRCYAVKVIPKRHIHFHGQNRSERKLIRHYDDLKRYCTEIHVLLRLREDPPALLPVLFLHEVFLSSNAVHVVTDLLGEELGAWRNRVEECTERMVIDISRTVLNAIEYMHSRGVVHRDMKMNNILFRHPDDFNSLVIVDFGLACVLEEEEDTARILCGTPGYIPPEMYLGEPYRFEVDLFAFGVIVFRLLSGNAPFPNHNSRVLRDRTIDLQYNVNHSDWTGRSDAALDFVHKLIAHRSDRMTVDEAFEHPWFREEGASILPVDVSYSGASNAIRIVSQNQKLLWVGGASAYPRNFLTQHSPSLSLHLNSHAPVLQSTLKIGINSGSMLRWRLRWLCWSPWEYTRQELWVEKPECSAWKNRLLPVLPCCWHPNTWVACRATPKRIAGLFAGNWHRRSKPCTTRGWLTEMYTWKMSSLIKV